MELDQDTKDKLLAVIAGKQMQVLRFRFDDWIDATPQMVFDRLGTGQTASVRIKPEPMCELAGVQYPVPMSARRADGDDYYVASPQSVDQHTWRNDSADEEWLSLHICHTTREAAEAHSQAMRAVNAQAVAKAKEQA